MIGSLNSPLFLLLFFAQPLPLKNPRTRTVYVYCYCLYVYLCTYILARTYASMDATDHTYKLLLAAVVVVVVVVVVVLTLTRIINVPAAVAQFGSPQDLLYSSMIRSYLTRHVTGIIPGTWMLGYVCLKRCIAALLGHMIMQRT